MNWRTFNKLCIAAMIGTMLLNGWVFYMHRRLGLPPKDHPSPINAMSFIAPLMIIGSCTILLQFPTRIRLIQLAFGMSLIVIFYHSFVNVSPAYKGWAPELGRSFLMGVGCRVKTATLYGPTDGMVTRDITVSGRWCKSPEKQLAAVERAMQRYINEILNDEEKSGLQCVRRLPEDGDRLHGFVGSTPSSGSRPELEVCGDSAWNFGVVPREHGELRMTYKYRV